MSIIRPIRGLEGLGGVAPRPFSLSHGVGVAFVWLGDIFFRMNAFSVEGPGLLAPDPGDFLHGQKVTKKPPRGLCPLWTPPLLLGRRGPGERSTTRWCHSSEPLRAPVARLAGVDTAPAGPPCRRPCRTAQQMRHAHTTRNLSRPHHAGGPVVSQKNRASRRRTQRRRLKGQGVVAEIRLASAQGRDWGKETSRS